MARLPSSLSSLPRFIFPFYPRGSFFFSFFLLSPSHSLTLLLPSFLRLPPPFFFFFPSSVSPRSLPEGEPGCPVPPRSHRELPVCMNDSALPAATWPTSKVPPIALLQRHQQSHSQTGKKKKRGGGLVN